MSDSLDAKLDELAAKLAQLEPQKFKAEMALQQASKWAPQSLFAAMKDTWFIESFESGMVRVIVMEPPKTHKYAYLTVPEVKSLIQSLQLACDAIDFKNKSEMPYTPQIPPEAQPTGMVPTPGVMQLIEDSPPAEDDF